MSTDKSPAQHEIAAADARTNSLQTACSIFSITVLAAIFGLALMPGVEPTLADRITFFVLAVGGALCFWTRGLRFFEERSDAATFAVTLVMFLLYGLARQAGPQEGWSISTALLPDTKLVVSYAARVAIVVALFSTPLWWRHRNVWTNSLLSAIVLIALMGLGSFLLLGRFYAVGETEIVDPTPLVQLLLQVVEFASLALLCSAVCAMERSRRWVLRLLPLILFILWARFQFFPAPQTEEAE